ncbi:MAG: MiaB/RimO family radical SAM methylthiotransferase [Chitinivibrionales bacterium]|nr:MiaB/RimO family radical SAM methylthiotransferase [Chitinivibrionales bacterium]
MSTQVQLTVGLLYCGCRTNQQEIEALSGALVAEGFAVCTQASHADIIIVNTCSVTARAESDMKRLITSLGRKYPQARLCITGCLAQQVPEQLIGMPGVTWVVGNGSKDSIVSLLRQSQPRRQLCLSPFQAEGPESVSLAQPKIRPVDAASGRTRFLMKIQEGCDNRCSYCIVPSLRGPSRSVSREMVMTSVDAAIDAGYKEIVLTGTHIGQYKSARGYTLIDLLNDILRKEADVRLRLSSLDPADCTEEIFQCLETHSRLCNHLHLSMQHLHPTVLTKMNRSVADYDRFFERLALCQSRVPNLGIGADFIVGFPGETGKEFEYLSETVAVKPFSYGHVFRYSARPGTAAVQLPGAVDEAVKRQRAEVLRQMLLQTRSRFIQRQIQRVVHRIIVEDAATCRGVTANYIQVAVPNGRASHNSWLAVVLTDYEPAVNRCIGRCADEGDTLLSGAAKPCL